MTKRVLLAMGLFTLFGLGLLGIYLMKFVQHRNLSSVFADNNMLSQLTFGLAFGLIAGINALIWIKSPLLRDTKTFFNNMLEEMNIGYGMAIFMSFCAGVGEEILFRGAIQHSLGLWPTSVLFVFIHGYLTPFNWRISIYGLLMVFISAGLGYLMIQKGIYAAMTAHFIFDVMLFFVMVKEMKGKESSI